MNVTGSLLFMLGATDTARGPEVAPAGIVTVMDVPLQELIVIGVPFNFTTLLPCDAPNPVPVITTWFPIDPVVAETLVVTGAEAAAYLIETLSKVAVPRLEVLPLVTARPI